MTAEQHMSSHTHQHPQHAAGLYEVVRSKAWAEEGSVRSRLMSCQHKSERWITCGECVTTHLQQLFLTLRIELVSCGIKLNQSTSTGDNDQ